MCVVSQDLAVTVNSFSHTGREEYKTYLRQTARNISNSTRPSLLVGLYNCYQISYIFARCVCPSACAVIPLCTKARSVLRFSLCNQSKCVCACMMDNTEMYHVIHYIGRSYIRFKINRSSRRPVFLKLQAIADSS